MDREAASQEAENPKKAKAMQDKAQKDAAKLLKNFKKIQKKADKINNKDIKHLDREIERLGATAQRILNNVNHGLRLPVGNVRNFAEMLNDGLGKFNEQQLKSLSDEVYKNSNRLSSMIMNML